MDKNLRDLCREVADYLRKEYNPDATVTIKGDCTFAVVYNGLLTKPGESVTDLLKYR